MNWAISCCFFRSLNPILFLLTVISSQKVGLLPLSDSHFEIHDVWKMGSRLKKQRFVLFFSV